MTHAENDPKRDLHSTHELPPLTKDGVRRLMTYVRTERPDPGNPFLQADGPKVVGDRDPKTFVCPSPGRGGWSVPTVRIDPVSPVTQPLR